VSVASVTERRPARVSDPPRIQRPKRLGPSNQHGANLAGRFLFGLDPKDARAYAVAMITLTAAALVATVLPARRAASVDPSEALRNE